MLKTLVHFILKRYSQKKYHSFLRSRSEVETLQTQKLQSILNTLASTEHYAKPLARAPLNYHEFSQLFPITTYKDYQSLIELQRRSQRSLVSPRPERYQPTSGSTSARKWVPYTKEFLREIDQASLVWLHDLYLHYPKISQGTHYWSLSWLPTELRQETSNDDLNYLDFFTKSLLSKVMAVPAEVQETPSLESSLFATLCWLVSREDLSFIFVWSPTFFLSLLQEITLKRQEIVATLESGQWAAFQTELQAVAAPHSPAQAQVLKGLSLQAGWPMDLWKNLALLSCWSSADSAQWIPRIQELCPKLAIQGKGLFATEAVVTIPVQGSLHLSYQSHFYEFLLPDGSVKLAHQLKIGERARVLVTSTNGFVRYDLGDELRVVKMVEECPVLEFLGRTHTVDLVGEKMDHASLKIILEEFRSRFKVRAIGFLAGPTALGARYVLVVEGREEEGQGIWLENTLKKHHHYALAVELGQLDQAQVIYTADGLGFLEGLIKLYGWNRGDVKWETVLKVPQLTINV
jgi:hypothetical protein